MSHPLWNTQNDLSAKVCAVAVGLLNQQLADALDLALQAKQAHWNIKGSSEHADGRGRLDFGRRSNLAPRTESRVMRVDVGSDLRNNGLNVCVCRYRARHDRCDVWDAIPMEM